MNRFVDIPHLPQGYVCSVIIGEKYKSILQPALSRRGIDAIWLKDNLYVDSRLSGHCDLTAVHLGGNRLAVQEGYSRECEKISNIEIINTAIPREINYPYDSELNFCIIGNRLIYNPKTANKEVIEQIKTEKISCKQGYTRCSICVVDEDSIITADKCIAAKATAAGMNVLHVKENLVKLDGFEYGFIGGATFKLSKNELAFTGLINDYNEQNRIESFLKGHGVQAVYLTSKPLFDIGSAIPIIENI